MSTLIFLFPLIFPLYIIRFKIGPFPTTALETAFLALALLVTWNTGWRIWRDGLMRTAPWHLPAALWTFATLIAIFIAPHPLAAFGLWRAYVLEPILYAILLAGTLTRASQYRTVICALIGAVIFIAGIAIFQFLGMAPIPHPWNTGWLTRRATGPFPFPNAISLFCVPISALCIGLLLSQKKTGEFQPAWMRLMLWLGAGGGMLAIILAKSVGGFLALCVATLIALLWNPKTRRTAMIVSSMLALAILLTPILRAPIISHLTFNEWSGKVRLIVWRETWEMLKDRPLFGAGFGAYPEAMRPYHRATFIEIFQYPHNLLLNFLSETGLLGIFAFGWICFTWVRYRAQAFLLPLITILIHGLVDVPYFKNDLAFVFWTLAVLNHMRYTRISA